MAWQRFAEANQADYYKAGMLSIAKQGEYEIDTRSLQLLLASRQHIAIVERGLPQAGKSTTDTGGVEL